MIKLRPYQVEARDATLAEWQKGNLDTLLAMSTGTGKTETFLSVLEADMNGGRALVIAHRQELIYQPRDRILDHWPKLGRPGIVMADQDECAAKLVIATIQTLASNGRLDRIMAQGQITHLITDEAHHSVASTYKELYKRLREHNPNLKHLGVTATPRRTDGDPLREIYQSVAYRMGIKQSIKVGALVPFVAMGFQLPVSIADVREVGDGWDDGELGDVLKARNAEEIVIQKWEEHAKDRPTICFTASVAQAHSLAERFKEAGHNFEAADGTTPAQDRKAILDRFKSGETVGICNCALWTEGFDAPKASCLVQVRPTRSDLVYVQMAGRVLRRHPSKTQALILDFVPEDARELRLAGDLLGKPKEQREIEQKAQDQGLVLPCFGINSEGEGIDGDPDQVVVTVLDYLSRSRLSWTFDGELASATAGEKKTLAARMPFEVEAERLAKANEIKATGKWDPKWDREYERVKRLGRYALHVIEGVQVETLGYYETWDDLADAAEDFCDEQGLDILSKKRAVWRTKPATDKQAALLKRLGIWQDNIRRGEAAQRITHHFARKAIRV